MPDLTTKELQALLDKLEAVCLQARELQREIAAKMAATARGNYTQSTPIGRERRKTPRGK